MNHDRRELIQRPKAELHCHLEACFRRSTLRAIGSRVGIPVPEDDDAFDREWLVNRPRSSLEEMLRGFENVRSLWCDELAIRRLTAEAVEDAAAQGVRILELRYDPTFIHNGNDDLTFGAIHEAVLAGVADADPVADIAVGLIGIVNRNAPESHSSRAGDFIIANRDTFLAMDLAHAEAGNPGIRFRGMFERARAAGLGVTVHAAEIDTDEGRQNARDAVNVLGVQRIGHGLHIVSDPELVALVVERHIVLELCPTSNVITGTVSSLAAHPFKSLYDRGVLTTLNTDDPALFGFDWVHEHCLIGDGLGLGEADLRRCEDIAAAASLIPLEEKARVWPRPIPPLEAISPPAPPG